MSTHPNVILMLTLKPDDLARKTYRAIVTEAGKDPEEDSPQLKIGSEDYSIIVMEGNYDDNIQIAGASGDIIIYDLVTYGYGEQISWQKLTERQSSLAEWAKDICARHNCTAKFAVSANYW